MNLQQIMEDAKDGVLNFFGLKPLPSFPYEELKEPIPGISYKNLILISC